MTLSSRIRYIFSPALISCLLVYAASTAPAFAAQPNSYDIEVVIFSYRYPADNGEVWPSQAAKDSPDKPLVIRVVMCVNCQQRHTS